MKALRFLDDHMETIIIVPCLAGICIVMFFQVLSRNFFNYSFSWPEELCRIFFICTGSIGVSYATKRNCHLKLDVLTNIPKLKKPLDVFGDLTLLAIVLYLLKPGWLVVEKVANTGQLTTALRLPIKYINMFLIVGFVMTIFRIVEKYVKLFITKAKNKRAEETQT